MLLKKLLLTTLLSTTVICNAVPVTSVSAATYATTKKTYTLKIAGKKQRKKARGAIYKGKTIKTAAPGFVRGDTSMFSAHYIFKKGLGVSYSYSKKSKKVTLKRNSTTITMKCNSMYAYINGKKTKLPTPARSVYSYARKKSYIYVPGSFCAKKLGFSYSWSKSRYSGCFSVPKPVNHTPSYIQLKKPAGLDSTDITTTDDYRNRRLIVNIRGNYSSFFKNKANYRIPSDPYFQTYTVSYANGYTKIYIRPRKSVIKAYEVTQTDSDIKIRYASPKSIYDRIIVIDAGHGGSDSGAVSYGYKEKNMTLKIVQEAKRYFDRDSRYKVYYTRLSDSYPSLSDRSDLANNVGADRFLSVHINSASASATGTETLYNSKGYKSTSGLTSYRWSATLHPYIRSATGFRNRGLVNRTGLAVLRHTKTASSLTEIGFLSNKTEAKTMNSHLPVYGKAVYNSIVESFYKYPSKR